jgi:hypothetical protein
MADEQRRHRFLRKKATELYVTIAFARGRLHVRSAPRELTPSSEWDAQAWAALVAQRTNAAAPPEERASS